MTARGVFITFEGGEGSGKSTQLSLLADALAQAGVAVATTREPGGTKLGESVRGLLLNPENTEMDSRTELLLYEAARAQLVAAVVVPALDAGEVVLCDRFADSTTAYQGYGRGLPLAEIAALNAAATGGAVPDLTLVYDLDAAVGLERATEHATDRLEAEALAFHERVVEGFRAIASADPDRVALIDAGGSIDDVARDTLEAAQRLPVLAAALRRPGS